jgi:hypothetical protein
MNDALNVLRQKKASAVQEAGGRTHAGQVVKLVPIALSARWARVPVRSALFRSRREWNEQTVQPA